jgi:hypothetical protein
VPTSLLPTNNQVTVQLHQTTPLATTACRNRRSITEPHGLLFVVLEDRELSAIITLANTTDAGTTRHLDHMRRKERHPVGQTASHRWSVTRLLCGGFDLDRLSRMS